MDRSIIMILIPIGLILFALYRIWRITQQIQKKSKSQNWQVTSADVLTKKVEKSLSTKSGVSYFPVIEYQYMVMGQSYVKKIRLPKNYTYQNAEEIVNGIGTRIQVRYDPNQPKEHISEYEKVNYLELLLTMVILVVAVILLLPYLS